MVVKNNIKGRYSLVVMANNDTYYASIYEGRRILQYIEDEGPLKTFMFKDAKHNNNVTVVLDQVSSVVVIDNE